MASPITVLLAELSGAKTAFSILWPKLGFSALPMLVSIVRAEARGEPFAALGPPHDEKEALSRAQLASAVLLYKALKERMEEPEAFALTREVVAQASVDFLRLSIPVFEKKKMFALNPARQLSLSREMAQKFFNADIRVTVEGQKAVKFTISRCRFVELCAKVGEPKLAQAFCIGDALFFKDHQPDLAFSRPQELSTGGTCCDFQFHWKE